MRPNKRVLSFGVDVSCKDVIQDPQGKGAGTIPGLSESAPIEVRSDIVIGADGCKSSVARQVDPRTLRHAQDSIACVFAYYDCIRDTGSRWLLGQGAGAGGRTECKDRFHAM